MSWGPDGEDAIWGPDGEDAIWEPDGEDATAIIGLILLGVVVGRSAGSKIGVSNEVEAFIVSN